MTDDEKKFMEMILAENCDLKSRLARAMSFPTAPQPSVDDPTQPTGMRKIFPPGTAVNWIAPTGVQHPLVNLGNGDGDGIFPTTEEHLAQLNANMAADAAPQPDMVMVRREDLEEVLDCTDTILSDRCQTFRSKAQFKRLKEALNDH